MPRSCTHECVPQQTSIDRTDGDPNSLLMNEQIIYPRSPRETMCGWMHLPRYIDKIRLHLAGKLHPDYQPNFGKGFDGRWLEAAGLQHEQFIALVKGTITDGEVCDWVQQRVQKSDADKRAHADRMLNYPKPDDQAMQE